MQNIRLAAHALAILALATPAVAQEAEAPDEATQLAWHNTQQAALHSLRPGDGWHILEGGVRFRRTAGDGSGPAPRVRDVVSVNYTGRFASGEVFDSNEGRDPVTFPLARLVRGWQVAIPYMGVGDSAEIALPAEMGYGLAGGGPIPGGATLFFEIELVDVLVTPGG